ncbi:MAG: methyl-accepting chemotaxis protein [Peptococcaceae bacterium]
MTMAKKLIIGIGLLVTISLGVLQYINFMGSKEQIVRNEKEYYQLIEEIVNNQMDSRLKIAETSILSIINNPEVAKAFYDKDRDKLAEMLSPVYHDLASHGIAQFQFHLAPATSFLRLHMPAQYGDDLSSFRQTVVTANKEKRKVSGLEEGKAGFGFRVVVPVRYLGEHIGTAEYGTDFSQTFLEDLQKKIPGEYFIYKFTLEEDQLLAATLENDPFAFDRELRGALENSRELAYTYSADNLKSILLIPFKDYSGKPGGYIKAVISREDSVNRFNSLLKKSLTVTILSLILILGGVFIMIKSFTGPLNKLADILDEIASSEGDLTQRVHITSQDEVGRLAGAANMLLSSLQQTIKGIVESVNSLTSSAEQVNNALEESNRSMSGISMGIDKVAQGAQDNSKIIKDFNQAAEEVASSAQYVASASQKATEDSHAVNSEVKNTLAVMDKVTSTVNELDEERQEIDQLVKDLNSTTNSIANFVTVITNIAEQTNLLALNAAIESARAGEQGRGFAVVAEEIRKLAEESAKSAKEIAGIIQESKDKINGAIATTRQTGAMISVTVEQVKEVKNKITGIVSAIGMVNTQIQEMAAAAQEQSALSQEMHASIDVITKVTEETAAGTHQITSGIQQQAGALEEIGATMDDVEGMAQELLKNVQGFKI